MYWSASMTSASGSAGVIVGTGGSCAADGLVSQLEMWVDKGLVVRVDWGVTSLESRCIFEVHIAGMGRLSELCRECGNSSNLHKVGVT